MSFSIVTWNILADAYVRPHRYPNVDPRLLEPAARRARVCDRIRALDADIYLLQEVEPAAYDAIAAALGDAYEGTLALKPNRPEGSALFTRRAAVTVERVETHVFARQRPNDARGTLALLAQVTVGGQWLGLASTHLDWVRRPVSDAEDTGRAQLLETIDALAELLPAGTATVIGGDFNANSQSAPIDAALARGLRLSCRSQRPWDTTNINGRRRKIDYLLYTPDHLHPHPGRLPALTRDEPMPSSLYPSDHLPLSVRFTWAVSDGGWDGPAV